MPSEEIFYLPISELGRRIESKKLSSVDLTKMYLERSETLGPRFNAYAKLLPDAALEQANAADKEIHRGHYRGALHGIPYAAKDLLAVRGVATTWGSKIHENQIFDYDAAVIQHLNRAGAVLLGKAAMIELAGGMGYTYASASLQGPGKNPWNTDFWTGGSSSGSGAIVATGLAGFAIGTETWGSIICPAAFCGVTGFRPTYGRVSRYGVMTLAPSMDKIGPLARSAEDCARIFAAIAGHDFQDRGTLPIDKAAFTYSPAMELKARPLRVGWVSNAWKTIGPDVTKILATAETVLKKYFPSVKDVELPDDPADEAATVTVSVEGAATFRELIRSGRVKELADATGRLAGYVNEQISGADYVQAQRVREALQKKMAELFDSFDVLATASLPIAATAIETNLEVATDFPDPVGAIGNLCGLPAISVPCGFTEKSLPVGLQFVAKAGDDIAVIQAARMFQQHTEWHRKHPKLVE